VAAEVREVARCEGVDLPADLAHRHLAFADGLEARAHSSLHDDLTQGRRMELEALLGEVVRRRARAEIAVPMNEALYAVLQPWEMRSRAR
jgi:2-dehydropantoate 2-reductase